TDAFNSGAGPSSDGGLGGGVGANGAFTASSSFDIGGTGWFGGASGFVISSLGNQVRQQLWVNGPASGRGSSAGGASAYINGNVQTNLSIAGALSVPPPPAWEAAFRQGAASCEARCRSRRRATVRHNSSSMLPPS